MKRKFFLSSAMMGIGGILNDKSVKGRNFEKSGSSNMPGKMKIRKYNRLLILFIVLWITSCSVQSSHENHSSFQLLNFDQEWRFELGDNQDAGAIDFDDSGWRLLNLPHDWSIEGSFNQNNPSGWRGGFMPGGIGWYRKVFDFEPSWEDKLVTIVFDGIYMNSTVYLNGHELGHRPYGYTSFHYDLTPHLKSGKNVLAVRVDNSLQPSGRWYTGCGIYRHVWLHVDNPVHVPVWGIKLTNPQVSAGRSMLGVTTKIRNMSGNATEITLVQELFDSSGRKITDSEKRKTVSSGEMLFDQELILSKTSLWSPDHPALYTLQTTVFQKGEVIDQVKTKTGFRKMEFKGESGFWLNGENIKFKGVCLHHDAGNLGAAVPDDVLYRRLKILKEMGCNAIRTSHNPFAPEFYAMCDSMGFLVMNEAFDGWDVAKAQYDYGLYFDEWWQKDLTDFILRDRNHPCVVMWSIGNEVRGRTDEVEQELTQLVQELDPSRPVTIGAGHDAGIVDIAGFNGVGEQKNVLEDTHRDHPEWPIIGTEVPHSWQTRGVYRTKTWIRGRDFVAPWAPDNINREIDTTAIFYVSDLTKEELFPDIDPNYLSGYDNAFVRISSREQWQRTDTMDYMMGEFRWTGIDYLGENIYPNRGWHCGVIDLCGFPKDTYYFYQSEWTDNPMVYILPHWTHPGKEGIKIPIMGYSNCDEVELFLNGRSLGIQRKEAYKNLLWYVPYEAGELIAVGYIKGEEVCRYQRQTAGEPYGIKMESDKTILKADGSCVAHITFSVVDKNGVFVPHANHKIHFNLSGAGNLLTTENGDMLDHDPANSSHRKVFNGMGIAYIQSIKGRSGEITVRAQSNGLQDTRLMLKAE